MRPNVGEIVGVLSQQIIICVNGITIGSFVLTLPMCTVRACIIPSEVLVAGGPVVIVQWQSGVPVTVFPPQLALSEPFWPKT